MTVRIGEFIRCIGRRICCETISWNENYFFGHCNRVDCGTDCRMSVTSFVGLENLSLILRLKMRKVFLLPNVWKAGLLKLTITIGLQSSSSIKKC